jgi:hypothetical protein
LLETLVAWPNATGYTKPDVLPRFIHDIMHTLSREMLSKKDALLEQDSITCKLCNAKFESLGDMQRHTLTEHMQKGDYQIHLESTNVV